jgi:hypothetical protein
MRISGVSFLLHVCQSPLLLGRRLTDIVPKFEFEWRNFTFHRTFVQAAGWVVYFAILLLSALSA